MNIQDSNQMLLTIFSNIWNSQNTLQDFLSLVTITVIHLRHLMKFVTAEKIRNIFDQLISIRLKENLKILESILKALKS